ncbi:MAG: enhanced serine sensitivity protein SseB C-terminal domain-containing protein [Lachnospiraceae bacterium]|nr:enhanced serine sensitivity protein SseB C-terminal domain-containing protein [Lachnospiraceae bacterium]
MEISKERKEELLNTFLLHYQMPEREDLKEVSFEELEFLIRSAEVYHDKKEMAADNFLEKKERFTELLMSRIWQLEGLFVAGDIHTGYPHIMGDGTIMIFSDEDYAEKAGAHYQKLGLTLEIQMIPKDGIRHFFADCFWWGMEEMVLDMGTYSIRLSRSALLPPPDEKRIPKAARPIKNPSLMSAMIRHRQILFEEKKDENWKRAEQFLCDRMLKEIVRGRYLCPTQIKTADGKPVDHNRVMTLKGGAVFRFAMLSDGSGTTWFPAFTDWDAFYNMYERDEWNARSLTYEELIAVSRENGIIINPGSMETRIDENRKKILSGYLEREKRLQKELAGGRLKDCGNGIKIGVSVESTEEIEQALTGYLKTQKDVKRAFLGIKTDHEIDISYFLALDMKEDEKSVLEGITKALAGKLGAMRLDVRRADGALLKRLEGIPPFYKKGLFT